MKIIRGKEHIIRRMFFFLVDKRTVAVNIREVHKQAKYPIFRSQIKSLEHVSFVFSL